MESIEISDSCEFVEGKKKEKKPISGVKLLTFTCLDKV